MGEFFTPMSSFFDGHHMLSCSFVGWRVQKESLVSYDRDVAH